MRPLTAALLAAVLTLAPSLASSAYASEISDTADTPSISAESDTASVSDEPAGNTEEEPSAPAPLGPPSVAVEESNTIADPSTVAEEPSVTPDSPAPTAVSPNPVAVDPSSTTDPSTPPTSTTASSDTPAATSTETSTTTAAPTSTTPAPVYYRNCRAVWAAGEPFLWRWEAGYRAALDRDSDGLACEWDDRAALDRDENDGDGVHYRNCSEVRDAGRAPLWRWQAGYRAGLDRDDDGIACEWGDSGRDGHDGRDGKDGDDGEDGRDGETRVIVTYVPGSALSTVDDADATYTQWREVPSGSIATGAR